VWHRQATAVGQADHERLERANAQGSSNSVDVHNRFSQGMTVFYSSSMPISIFPPTLTDRPRRSTELGFSRSANSDSLSGRMPEAFGPGPITEEFRMKNKLLPLLLGVCASIATLGYFLQWYTVSIANAEHQVEIHVTIFKDKIKADEEKAKVKLEEYEKQFKENPKETSRKVERGARHLNK
jgi:hypothetical protein